MADTVDTPAGTAAASVSAHEPLSAPPRRIVWLILIGQLGWSTANNAATTLLQADSSAISPHDKVGYYATISTLGAIAAVIGIMLGGALSDRTRTRWGKRVPWLLGAGLVASLALAATGLTTNPVLVGIAFCVYQASLNALVGSLLALVPDHFGASGLGRASAFSGVGVLGGAVLGGVLGAVFVTAPPHGLIAVPWTILAAAIVLALTLPSRGNRDEPREPGGLANFLRYLLPPGDAQFWWVFGGRFLFMLGLFMIVQYQFFIASDYVGLGTQSAGTLLALCSLVLAVCAAAGTLVAGPLSDRTGRKPWVIGASFAVVASVIPLFLDARPWALIFAFAVGGAAYGAYLSVDAALTVDVLPDRHAVAKDLAVLNAANSLPIVIAAGAAGVLVQTLGYRAVFVAVAVAAVAGAGCLAFVRRVR